MTALPRTGSLSASGGVACCDSPSGTASSRANLGIESSLPMAQQRHKLRILRASLLLALPLPHAVVIKSDRIKWKVIARAAALGVG
jgi:hypothetical protein